MHHFITHGHGFQLHCLWIGETVKISISGLEKRTEHEDVSFYQWIYDDLDMDFNCVISGLEKLSKLASLDGRNGQSTRGWPYLGLEKSKRHWDWKHEDSRCWKMKLHVEKYTIKAKPSVKFRQYRGEGDSEREKERESGLAERQEERWDRTATNKGRNWDFREGGIECNIEF